MTQNNLQLKQIAHYSGQGKRDYQEDSYAFDTKFLMVSDGIGGMAKGEIASGIVVKVFSGSLKKLSLLPGEMQSKLSLMTADTLAELLQYATLHPESMGMGATLALLLQDGSDFVSVHIGDSRVCHFGPDGRLKWRSKDHSMVQELLDAGILTEAEAADHPKRNVISRFLQAKPGHKVVPGITILSGVELGDRLLVCSDGVTESWTVDGLSKLLRDHPDNDTVIDLIRQHCEEHSRDNHTALLATVLDTAIINQENQTTDQKINKDDSTEDHNLSGYIQDPPKQKSWWSKIFLSHLF